MVINDVLFNADLETILDELVAELRLNNIQYIQKMVHTSKDIQICCPYHNGGMERKPSAGIRKSDGMFHCFACNEVHTLPEVISHCFGKDGTGVFGWQWLLKNFATVGVEDRKKIELDIKRNRSNVDSNNGNDKTYVTEEELDKYRYYHIYWKERKITDEHLIELFDLGYDKETDCITMPNRDLNGNCLFVARRSVKSKYFSYPTGVEKPVYGLYEIQQTALEEGKKNSYSDYPMKIWPNEVIICESMIDALTCWQYGKQAVALNGLGTEAQFRALREFPVRKYILATDMDEAGLKARIRVKKALSNKLVMEYRWDISKAKDINDMEKPYFDGLLEHFTDY